jgi:hypothetical protein
VLLGLQVLALVQALVEQQAQFKVLLVRQVLPLQLQPLELLEMQQGVDNGN